MSHRASLGRLIFLYHLEHQIVQIYSWLYSKFKEISNDTSQTQIQVKTKKLWPRKVGEEKQVSEQKLCRDKARDELCHDKPRFCRDKAKDKFVMTNPDFVTIKPKKTLLQQT